MPNEIPLDALQTLLDKVSGYHWLTRSGQQFWSVQDVHMNLIRAGMTKLKESTVRNSWFKQMANTQDFGGALGLYASREDLIRFFAQRFVQSQGKIDDGEEDVAG